MNKDFIEELEILKCKHEQLGEDLQKLEEKYSYMYDHRLVSHLLAKAGITYIETTVEELNKETAMYVCERREDGKIILHLQEVSSYE